MKTPSFKEDHISQIPALQLLINLGYKYLTPDEALAERQGKTSNVLLEGILEERLRAINKIAYKGNQYEFSNSNIAEAVNTLKNVHNEGLVRTNEKIYDLLSLGKSFKENLQGNIQSFDLKYIDWNNLSNNVFHVTEEFEVERVDGKSHRRPDIVLFINGIPFSVIECKRPDEKDSLTQAISQNIRNQRDDEIPKLFFYVQILMGINKNEAKCGTVSTPEKFWSIWKEDIDEDVVTEIINTSISEEDKNKLISSRCYNSRDYYDDIMESERRLTYQDKALYSLVRPERLLELSYKFIVFEKGDKKIARYKQYFAVKKTLERVKEYEDASKRKGGVIWHTQGSGKSLTMVMIAKSLAIDPGIKDPRIVIVTDRIDLDDQIWGTFKHCGMDPVQAKTGKDLFDILGTNKRSIVTTVIKKFESGINARDVKIEDNSIFVLIDESHRSQYGTMHAMMKKSLPNACYIGFTGTPLLKNEKSTAIKFGGFIDKYTIDEAVADKAVVPLLYEGRHILQEVNEKPIDTWFGRVCEPLNDAQKADLKRKFSRIEELNSSEQTIYTIAYDVSLHYSNNWKDTGFKAQLATSRKVDALKYKEYFDEIGLVSTEVVISAPDEREGYEDVHDEPTDKVVKFWKKMMSKYSSEKDYNREVISSFKNNPTPEILIVVDKLLTGFDAPKNTILYIAKPLKEHSLLQAIARVNRVCEGKDYGFIVDYNGILGELDKALATYSAFDGFDEDDLLGTLVNVAEEVKTLPQKYSDLWDTFKTVKNKKDEEEYELLLFDEELRQKFYERLSAFTRTLGIALAVPSFYEDVSEEKINKYKQDLRFFQKLRASVKTRYAEVIDFKEYESKVKKLLDTYITSDEVIQITKQVNIFEKEKFQEEVARVEGHAARADMIAHRTKKTIEERYAEDPVFYERFSKLIEKAIEDYRSKRITEAEYFGSVTDYMESVRDRKGDDVPSSLEGHDVAKAFYGILAQSLETKELEDSNELSGEIALGIDGIILKNKIVDFIHSTDILNRMRNEIEDYLLDHPELKLNYEEVDVIMEKCIEIAKRRYA